MQGNREVMLQKYPRIILDKAFPIISQLDVGTQGQIEIKGIIEGEKMEYQEDGVDCLIKTVRIKEVELINEKNVRKYT